MCVRQARSVPGARRLLTQHPPGELSGRGLPHAEPGAAVRLLVFSHAYGRPGRAVTGDARPAPSLVAAAPDLAARRPDLVVSMGDFVFAWHPALLEGADQLFNTLGAPVLNAVGNHEMNHREAYVERYGATWGGLRLGDALLLVLDTEVTPWSLDSEQVEFVRRSLELAEHVGIGHVLCFAHKILFAVDVPRYEPLLRHVNAYDGWTGTSNFQDELRPPLEEFAKAGGEVLWLGGDIGVEWSYGLFFDRDQDSQITFIATGLGDADWDNVLQIDLEPGRPARIHAIGLTDTPLPPLEDCGPDFWTTHFDDTVHD